MQVVAATKDHIDQIAGHGTVPVYAYVDVVGVWHKRPLSLHRLRWLGSESKPLLKPPFLVRRPARFDPSYTMYTRLRQPSKACLGSLVGEQDGTLLTYVELARDIIFADDLRGRGLGSAIQFVACPALAWQQAHIELRRWSERQYRHRRRPVVHVVHDEGE